MTTLKKPDAPELPYVDDPLAPEIFSEGGVGFFIHHGNVSITFTSQRVDHATNPGTVNRVVVGRVVLPMSGAQGLAIGLYNFLKKNGFDPGARPEGQPVQ